MSCAAARASLLGENNFSSCIPAMRPYSALASDLFRRRVQHMLFVAAASSRQTLSSKVGSAPQPAKGACASGTTAAVAGPIPDPRNQRVLHAAVAGLPNAGKSTLLNYMVGDKVSAVSTKRHTTRENTLGIMTVEDAQVIFYDTPGFVSHEDRDDYKPALSAASREAIAEVNLTLLLVDASKDVTKRGLRSLMGLLERALRSRCELFLVLNKSDLVHPRDRLLETTDEIMDRAQEIMDQIDKEREGNGASTDGGGGVGGAPDFPCTSSSTEIAPKQRAKKGMRATSGSDDDCAAVGDDRCDKSKSSSSNSSKSSTSTSSRGSVEGQRPLFRDGGKSVDDHVTVFMISAKAGHGVQDVVDFLVHRARPGPWLFGKDETTNIDKRSRVKEIVREGLYKHLYKELPYQITTHIRLLTQRPDSSVFVLLELRLDRASQKPIVLGKLRYIKKDVEWDLRKVFGARVDARFSVIVGHRKG
ncbi:unnamed protein product [Pylaiella littoralis]